MTNDREIANEALGTPEAIYRARSERFGQRRDYYEGRWSRVANGRLALFVLAVAAAGGGLWLDSVWLYAAAALLALGFVAAIVYHARLGELRRRYDTLRALNDEGLARLRCDWAALPQPPATDDEAPGFAGDLDLLGHASLQQLLSSVGTPVGHATLRRWLLEPAPPATVLLRQAAVAELVPLRDFRDELALRGRLMAGAQLPYERLLQWAETPGWLLGRPWLVWSGRALALLALAALALQSVAWGFYPLTVALMALNGLLTLRFGRLIDEALNQVSARQGVFPAYAELFDLIGAQQLHAPALRQLQDELVVGGVQAGQQIRQLGRISSLGDLRASIFFLPIQLLTLWNFHVLWLLERWQARAGERARAWLAALGELEALAALAALRHDNPGWCFPELVADGEPLLTARQLGHPLLPDGKRVANDLGIGPPGSFLLITGSNMSGKSTLLRAIGINVVLAQAGGPVCAAALRLPPLTLATSVRVQDSLEQGVSYFMAELRRLKAVVDLAQHSRQQGGPAALFLLDEILHGTNTGERQIAARRVISYLLEQGAIGAVSTHDLALADGPPLQERSRPVHFTESFLRGPDGPSMDFDYTLRPGIATSTNALALMELLFGPEWQIEPQTELEERNHVST